MFLLKSVVVLCAVSLARASTWLGELVESGHNTLVQCQRQTRSFQFPEENFQESAVKMKTCVETVFLESLDNVIESNEIPISDDITLVNTNKMVNYSEELSEGDHNIVTTTANKIHSLLNTHDVKINLSAFEEPESADRVEGRRRRFRKMFPMIVAAFMLMAAFVVPLGFQFMAMIGGKALLLSKLAFFSAMYAGYRRVTTDVDFHHHHPEPFHHHLGYHRRRNENLQPQTDQYFRVG